MAWNQPGNEPGDKPGNKPRSGPRPPAGNSLWRRWRQRWIANPHERGRVYAAAAGMALLLWLSSGFYQINDGERGVLQRFGAFAGLRTSGPGWHPPWPIETVTAVNLGKLNSADFQSRMFTLDALLVNVTASIQYQYADARAVLFATRDPDALVRELGESVARELIGQRRIEEVMGGAARAPLTEALRVGIQQPLDAMGAGIHVLSVNLTDVQVPEAVLAAQHELVQARVERERLAREAQGYAAELVPAAQGVAQRERLDAEAYKLQIIGVAEGDAARFDPMVAAYARAPEVTRNRLYIETIESILARSRKLIIDGKSAGNTLMLSLDKLSPDKLSLDKLSDAGALRGAGVVGSVPTSAANAAAANVAAPTAGAAPTAAAAPAATVPAARDDRGRERGDQQ